MTHETSINGSTKQIDSLRVHYMHLRRPLILLGKRGLVSTCCAKGGITVAFRQLSETHYKVGFTRCRPNEHFNKGMGRISADLVLAKGEEVWDMHVTAGSNLYTDLLSIVHGDSSLSKALRPVVQYRGSV